MAATIPAKFLESAQKYPEEANYSSGGDMAQRAVSEKVVFAPSKNKESTLFWNLYARCYDSLYHLLPYRKLLWDCLEALDLKHGMQLLNANCDTGNFELFLTEKSISGIAVETISRSSESLKLALKKCKDLNFVNFMEADVTNRLAFPDSYFDRILFNSALFSVKKKDLIFSELYRVLKPNGKLVLVSPLIDRFATQNIINEHYRKLKNIWGLKRKTKQALKTIYLTPKIKWLIKKTIDEANNEYTNVVLDPDSAEKLLKRSKFNNVEIFLSNAGQNWVISGNKTNQMATMLSQSIKPILLSSKREVCVREATHKDIDKIHSLEVSAWGEESAASKNKLKSRIEIFSAGNFIAEVNNTIVGYLSFLLTDYDLYQYKTWYEVTSNGYSANHDYGAKDFFGISLTVSEHAPIKTSKLLVQAVVRKGIEFNVRRYILGSRMPSYHLYSDKVSAENFVKNKTFSGKFKDPELQFYSNYYLEAKEVIPNYFKDSGSKNYGVIFMLNNPLSKSPKVLTKLLSKLHINQLKLINNLNRFYQ